MTSVGNSVDADGWASRSLATALRRGSIIGLIVSQLVLVGAATTTGLGSVVLAVVLGHALIVAVLIGSLVWELPADLLFALVFAGYVADYAVAAGSSSALTLIALWMACITTATPALLLRGRRLVLLVVPA